MPSSEEAKHDILLIITVSLFIFCVTGLGIKDKPVTEPNVIP